MVSTSGSTKQILTSVNAKINSTSMGEADTILSALIESISIDELKIIAPELRETIEQFSQDAADAYLNYFKQG